MIRVQYNYIDVLTLWGTDRLAHFRLKSESKQRGISDVWSVLHWVNRKAWDEYGISDMWTALVPDDFPVEEYPGMEIVNECLGEDWVSQLKVGDWVEELELYLEPSSAYRHQIKRIESANFLRKYWLDDGGLWVYASEMRTDFKKVDGPHTEDPETIIESDERPLSPEEQVYRDNRPYTKEEWLALEKSALDERKRDAAVALCFEPRTHEIPRGALHFVGGGHD